MSENVGECPEAIERFTDAIGGTARKRKGTWYLADHLWTFDEVLGF